MRPRQILIHKRLGQSLQPRASLAAEAASRDTHNQVLAEDCTYLVWGDPAVQAGLCCSGICNTCVWLASRCGLIHGKASARLSSLLQHCSVCIHCRLSPASKLSQICRISAHQSHFSSCIGTARIIGCSGQRYIACLCIALGGLPICPQVAVKRSVRSLLCAISSVRSADVN
jgi:hypothetical protein